eukprot:TRINITY_DN840_c0_g2_i1.p1 TRINITY_DN840_c0_g2~~TRINITY_DN840_c0_g2_i1.p1  ORF type:complete len:304 (+),score=104.72 TRINITY_DN840_c0_g2_i1:557-1468(+)
MQGFNHKGYLIYHERLGQIDTKGLIKYASVEDLVAFHIYIQEMCHYHKVQRAKELGLESPYMIPTVLLQDLHGLGMNHLYKPALAVLQQFMEIDENHYPETLERLSIIRNPGIFSLIWKIVKPWLDPAVLEKTALTGGSYQDELEIFYGDDISRAPEYLPEGSWKPNWSQGGMVPDGGDGGLDLEEVTVSSGSTYEHHVHVEEEDTVIEWNFVTKHYDIGFGVHLEVDEEELELVTPNKYQADIAEVRGTLLARQPGKYVLTFDNSHSYFRSKTVMYRVTTDKMTEDDYHMDGIEDVEDEVYE